MKQIDPARPFLRWAGGKTWLKKEIDSFLPKEINRYYEPFLGGASIFLHLAEKAKINEIHLSDSNSKLIDCYNVVKNNVEDLIQELGKYKNTSKEYYSARSQKHRSKIKQAAQFIYLNRTSFNGLYRENLKGVYNVPYGHKDYKVLFDFENLRKVSSLLQNANIETSDFQQKISAAKEGDFCFIDPPYTVAHENNGFVKYNQKIFLWDDQLRLADEIKRLVKKKVKFMSTNAFHESLLELYKKFATIKKLERHSVISGDKDSRKKCHEMLISNVE